MTSPIDSQSPAPATGVPSRKRRAARIAFLTCTVMVLGMLGVGLSPFGPPKNEVTWLGGQDGLRFGSYAMVLSSTPFPSAGVEDSGEPACTIEVYWQSSADSDGATVLAFSTAENPVQLSLRNYRSMALLQKGIGDDPQTIGLPDVFVKDRPVFLTVTSGAAGSSIFVDGERRGVFPGFHFGRDCHGQLVIGASPVAPFKSRGKLLGLTILKREIEDSEALRRYQTWSRNHPPDTPLGSDVAALYRFDEHRGNLVHNALPGGVDLEIPTDFFVLHKPWLEPFWKEYKPGWSHWEDILVNVVGFIPLGLVFYACALFAWSLKRPVLASVAMGFAVSLTIEVGQGLLPSRSSGTLDLITNTLGTYIGVLLQGARITREWTNRGFQRLLSSNLSAG